MAFDPDKVDLKSLSHVTRGEGFGPPDGDLKFTMSEAVKIDPVQRANVTKLSKESGVPEFAVEENPDLIEHDAKLNQFNFSNFRDRSPKTAAYIDDFNNAIIAQEDLDALEQIEAILTPVADVVRSFVGEPVKLIGGSLGGMGKLSRDVGGLTTRGVRALGGEQIADFLQEPILPTVLDPATSFIQTGAMVKGLAETIGTPRERQNFATHVSGALGQIVGYALAPSAGLTAFFTSSYEQGADKAKAAGADEQTQVATGMLFGITTLAAEKTGMDLIFNRIPPNIRNAFIRKTVDVVIGAGLEGAEEWIEGVTHQLISKGMYDPDAEIKLTPGMEEAAAGTAAGIMRLVLSAMGAKARKQDVIAEDVVSKESQNTTDQIRIDQLDATAKDVKMKEHSKDSFKQFVEQADGDNNTNIFIDGAQTALYLQTKTEEEITADPALMLLRKGADEAAALGGQIEIPVAEFSVEIAGTDHFTALRDSMTMSDVTVASSEQERIQQEDQTFIRNLMDELNMDVSQDIEAQEIYETVRSQLIDSGQVNPANASIMALLVPEWATARATRTGKTVQQVYADSGLVIEGPLTGEQARLESEQVLLQDIDLEALLSEFDDTFLNELSDQETQSIFDAPIEQRQQRLLEVTGLDKDAAWTEERLDRVLSGNLSVEGTDSRVSFVNPADFVNSTHPDPQVIADEAGQLDVDQLKGESQTPFVWIGDQGDIVAHEGRHRMAALAAAGVKRVPISIRFMAGTSEADVVSESLSFKFKGQEFDTGVGTDLNVSESYLALPENREVITQAMSGADLLFQAPITDQIGVTTADIQASIREEFEGVKLNLMGEGQIVTLSRIVIPEDQRDLGVGTEVMNRVTDWADANGKTVALSPSKDFGGTIGRLKEFYKGLGFIENKGKNKDFEISESMYRPAEVVEVLEQPTSEGAPGARGYYDPANSVIRLTEAADLSTFLHEFAHFMYEMEKNGNTEMLQSINKWYKRNAANVAKEANTYRGEKFDAEKQGDTKPAGTITEADITTYLDDGTTGDKGKDSAIRRALHEQLARGFEVYLMEGKAPSIELRNAFRTFARWLSQIYQTLRGKLKVNLDAEMRQVFDRLLATEEQIAAAEARARVEPMFTDAVMAGMTEEEFADYQQRQSKVKDVQTETLRDKLIKQLTRQTKTWWKAEKQDVYDEELEILKAERVHVAREQLKRTAKPVDDLNVELVRIDEKIIGIEKEIKGVRKGNDTVGKFIAKEGGLNREDMIREGMDPADMKRPPTPVFGKPMFPKRGGMTADDVAEKLNEEGFNGGGLTANDALGVINDMLGGDDPFIDMDVEGQLAGLENEASNLEFTRTQVEDDFRFVNLKLDFATVKEMIGEQKTDKRGRKSVVISPKLRGMTAKEHQGLHPDEAAAVFGYQSGSEMLDDLINAPSIGESADMAAERRMVERHGDILTDGTIEREADEAVQSEERGKLLLHELKMLARGTNAPTSDLATIKAIATNRIGKLSFRQIHPGKYRSAEIKAANEAGRMLAEGNKEGAAVAKLKQTLNYYLGMEATAAKNGTVKILDNMARYNKKKVQTEIMKSNGGHWEQIVGVLERFEFRKSASLKQVEAVNENINTWAKSRMENEGDGLVLSNAVLNESYITHWKNVPYSDLQGINDSVKNIEHVARYSNKIKMMGEEIEFKKLKGDWVGSIETNEQRFERKDSKSRTADSRKATLSEHVRRWAAQLTKIPFLASWLDGGERVGLSHQILIQPLTDALDAKMNLIDEVATPVNNAIKNRSEADQKRHMQKIWIPEIKDHLMGHQILAVALNVGNAGNLRKLLLGEGWADPDVDTDISIDNPQLQAVLQHMTKTDWELVQLIWDQMDILYPQLAEVHRKTTGLTPPKVVATPVETKFGTFKGGYYTVKYSPTRSHKAEKNAEKREAETESMFNNTASIQASVNAGATNERTGFYDRIYLSLDVVSDHFNETIHYITHHEAVRQINRLIQSPDVANAITGVLGEAEFKQMKPWLNDVAKDGRQQPTKTFIDEIFQRLRFGTTLGVMGFKASTGIMQFFGLFTTAAELGVGPTVKGIQSAVGRSWYMKALRNTLGSTDDMQTGWDFAVERSKVLQHRIQTMDREIRNAMTRLKGERGIIAATQEASMKHIALIQTYMVDLPTWLAAYDKTVSETGDEAKAAQTADFMVESLQGSGNTKDMAAIVRNQSKVITTFTMFMTFFSSLGNLSRDVVKGTKTGQYSPTSVAAKLMFLYTIPVFLEMLMRGQLEEPEDEDDRLGKYATQVALYPLTSIPFVRDVASGLLGDFGYNSSPVSSMIEKGISGAKGIANAAFTDAEITKSQIKNVSKLTGAALGIPGVSQMWSTGEHLYDVLEEGEEATVRESLFGPKRD